MSAAVPDELLEQVGANIRRYREKLNLNQDDFADRAGMSAGLQETANKVSMTPAQVAQAGIAALLAGEAELIPGALNKISSKLTGLVPKSITEKIAAGIYEKHLK